MSTLEETQKQPEHNYKAINNPQTIEKKIFVIFPILNICMQRITKTYDLDAIKKPFNLNSLKHFGLLLKHQCFPKYEASKGALNIQ